MNDHEHELTTAAMALNVLAHSETFPRELRTTLSKARGKVAHMLAVIQSTGGYTAVIRYDRPLGDGGGERDITKELLEVIRRPD